MPTKRAPHTFLIVITAILGVASIAARFGEFHWIGDAFALVTDYYIWILLLLLAAFIIIRAWRWVVVACVILAINGWSLTSYARAAGSAPTDDERSLRIMMYNIYHRNPDLNGVIDEIKRHDPDVVFLMEYSDAIQQQIESAFAAYPHRLIRPSRMTMGLALFSRIPFESAEIHRFEATRIPIYQAEMIVHGTPITFIGGHPWPPQPQWGQLHRNQMLEITRIASRSSTPLIVAGDFNAAPWSYMMQNLSESANVENVRQQFDITKTWFPVPFFGLPLDHVLVSDEWRVLKYQYGNPGGSDHAPMIIDLLLLE
jgi:endonuclease/exonuclease/phosphatase (EEP) superfamily protein YafD